MQAKMGQEEKCSPKTGRLSYLDAVPIYGIIHHEAETPYYA
jgi:hypothetical protein